MELPKARKQWIKLGVVVTVAIGSLMCAEIGLIYATGSKDIKTLYTLIKSLNIFIFAPVIFYIFPNWPQWIAKLFPTYWFINPIWDITIRGYQLADVWFELAIALGISQALEQEDGRPLSHDETIRAVGKGPRRSAGRPRASPLPPDRHRLLH